MSLLRSGRAATVQVRGFTSSSNLRVGPESPHFVDVPRAIQPSAQTKPRVKGTLPVPREIFPARRPDKKTKQYIDDATQVPATGREVKNSSDPEKQEFRLKMAALRRKNLRQGLRELYQRKRVADERITARSQASQAQRDRVLYQPERDDERLTRPSIVQAMLHEKMAVLPDPNREERLAQSKARMESKLAEKEMERLENLQHLYMNARKFITTEEQLDAEIAKVFPTGSNKAWSNDHSEGESVWNLGNPRTVESIVNEGRKSETQRWDILQGRLKKIGEQITGGKL
ncbi:uncharacterized protein PFLUO_LOCUS7887 [Penicillium psychrofluorescens]|uniref:uncharacterized protein n=1 Tax=Penicillium psychrofluorescens TaxID=3158075 RepID=UPI003CCD306D